MVTNSVKLSSVQINLPAVLAKEILAWSNENIHDDDLHESPGCGREDELHATVLFGLHTQSPALTKEIARQTHKFAVELTTMSLFTSNPDFDVVKIGVKCQELHELNSLFRKRAEYSNRFNEYNPHVTLAYIKKGRGWKFEGEDEFEGRMFEADMIIFSDSDRHKTSCPLRSA